ncbi:MAG: hypothetical protein ACE5GH_06660, partial [Fidelibacterota bacterium]
IGGDGSEELASLDSSDSWWERDNDSSYYSIREYSLESSDAYSSKGTRPSLTITLERDLSSKLVFRSFLSGSRSTTDISGAVSSSDTTYGDRTYDVWDRLKDRTYFQRRESHSSRESGLDGSGEETTRNWRWFASLIYAPHGHWSAFAGIQLENSTLERTMDETSGYRSHRWEEYTGFKDAEYRNTYSQEKLYSVKMNFEKWTVFLPVGIKVGVVPGLNVILGTDLTLTLTDENSEGRLLYPERITRRWENGTLVVEDIEIDRYEEYTSDPAKNLSRSVQQRFGLVYDHPSGAKLFVRSFGDIFQTTNWALGFEMTF